MPRTVTKQKRKAKRRAKKELSPDDSMDRELIEGRGKTKRIGIAYDWEYTGSVITNMKTGEQWPGFRFKMLGKGGATWWTGTFADRSNPIRGKKLPTIRLVEKKGKP